MDVLAAIVNGRRDKNDVLLQDLVNAKNWKQALTSCEKRIKKGEKNEVLLVGFLVESLRSHVYADDANA